ncbi:ParA family protein [Catenovulum sp. 2E275]|uniref:ParA family protein n=1 Tax=Catenovulum sp. 2E275 TaxID=2980497 RepID=UPI0021CE5FEE|nr:ParA family protein [Catenovulum sp. 2E275]MCU4675593.1 ParA family protein [Catenovulum sp. 2E275]
MVITFGNKKGGVWKSTTLLNTACVAAHKGYRVCVVDADTNETSNTYLRRRNETNSERLKQGIEEYPFIKSELKRPDDSVGKDLQALDENYDYVFVDTGGYENKAFTSAIQVSDVIYMPFQPCQVDMDQLVPTLKVIIDTEDMVSELISDYMIDARLLVVGADHNSKDLVMDAKAVSKHLESHASLSSATITVVKKMKKIQDEGLMLADIKHPKRSMYEILFDEIQGKRKLTHNRIRR